MQVHLYQESEEERARQKALAMDKKAELMGFNPLSLKIERGTQVDAEITVYDDGVRVTKTARQLTWNGGLTSAVFEIKAEDSNLQSITGDVTLSVKGIPVGELSFNTDIVPSAQVDNTPKLGKTKQFDKAFISYSHDDVHTAEVAANILDTLGMCYFFDHHSLKSGAVFGEEIMQSIRESDVFILLWSEHAAQSDYVEKEYLYAKQFAYPQKPKEIATLVIKPYFIEPHADPPAELRIYNFSEMHTRH